MIDWTRISALRAEIGEENLHEVIGLFIEETDEVIARLDERVADSALASLLHFLKGSALNLGFSDLAAICHEGERKATRGEDGDIDLERIISLYCASRMTFLNGLALHSAA